MRSTVIRLLSTTALSLIVCLGLLSPTVAGATTQVSATTAVNVRSQPSTSATIVGGLYRGQTVTAISESRGWTKISYRGKDAYVSSAYLTKGKNLPSTAQVNSGAVRTTTTAVNLRRGPSLSDAIVTVLAQGTRVTTTGTTAKGWTEVLVSRARGWVSSQYLTASASGLPAVIGTRIATADLDIRTTSGADSKTLGEVKKGTKLSVTGATANGRAQIVYRGAARWVTARYLSNTAATQPAAPPLPKITGTRYATADLTIRSNSSDTYYTIGEIPRGSRISITGMVRNGRMRIVWDGAERWVTAKYLSTTRPPGAPTSAVEKGLKPNAIKVLHAVLAKFPQIRTVYGVRKDVLPDHPSGRALDFMLPNYTSASGKVLGFQISRYLQANHKTLGVNYVIYDQHIWNELRDQDGWRYMASRGGPTADHKDHVHVTVLADGYAPI